MLRHSIIVGDSPDNGAIVGLVMILVQLPSIVCVAAAGATVVAGEQAISATTLLDRPDRLLELRGPRAGAMVAEFSIDGQSWRPATMYVGTTADAWRDCDPKRWNEAVVEGRVPAGDQSCLWNYLFDVDLPARSAAFRLRATSGDKTVLIRKVDLTCVRDVVVIDRRNVASLAGGTLDNGWVLKPGGVKRADVPSLGKEIDREKVSLGGRYYRYKISNPDPTPLVLRPKVTGWHRVYVGMEPYSTARFWLSKDDVRYAVPNYYVDGGTGHSTRRLCQEFYVCSADMTDQDVCIAPGGSRFWREVSVRYIRLVPMTPGEIGHFRRVRKLAETKGRPFAGYLEPCTPLTYEPAGSVSMRQHTRNEMRHNKMRGSTDVYVHVIRIGSVAWYHSDVVERSKLAPLMAGEDPMVAAVEEGRAVGLKIFADVGMNATYYGSKEDMTERFAREHPEYLCPKYRMCFDYRKEPVQEYVGSIIRELLMKYDVDGVSLDFARWGHRAAYDRASLVAVVRQVHEDRWRAATKWAHPVTISARIDYDDPPAAGQPAPAFIAALREWAKAGLVDRIMVNGHKRISASTSFEHYVNAIAGTKTRLWADMYWGTWPKGAGPAKDFAIARAWIAQGFNGGIFYYMRARPIEWERINWQMRLVDLPDVWVDPHHAAR